MGSLCSSEKAPVHVCRFPMYVVKVDPGSGWSGWLAGFGWCNPDLFQKNGSVASGCDSY